MTWVSILLGVLTGQSLLVRLPPMCNPETRILVRLPPMCTEEVNFQRQRRRARLFKQQRESALVKAEGRSYKGGRFGAENVLEKKCDKAQG